MMQRPLPLLLAGDSPRRARLITAQQPAFRSAIDVVSMNVTVTDSTTKYVTDLTEKDFEIFEDGVKQELTLFNRTNLPVALSLLIDTSSSMEDRMATAQDAAIGFVRKLRPTDLGEVIGFDSRAEVLQKFTSNTRELEQAIRKTVAGGSTSMNNAIYISLKGLKKIPVRQEEEIRRQAIVLLSDGEDTSSLVHVRRRARPGAAIGDGDLRHRPDGREAAGDQSQGLPRSDLRAAPAHERHRRPGVLPRRRQEPRHVYGQIYDELSSQYTIGYTSKNPRRDGAWRRLVVRVAPAERAGPHQAGILRADWRRPLR